MDKATQEFIGSGTLENLSKDEFDKFIYDHFDTSENTTISSD
jgi:hypothetical protein